jgi:hypothetical protein
LRESKENLKGSEALSYITSIAASVSKVSPRCPGERSTPWRYTVLFCFVFLSDGSAGKHIGQASAIKDVD